MCVHMCSKQFYLYLYVCGLHLFLPLKMNSCLGTMLRTKIRVKGVNAPFKIKKGVILSSHITGVIYRFIFLMLHDNNVIYFSSSHHH